MTQNQFSFELPSNSGWCKTTWKFYDVIQFENRRLFATEVIFNSSFWNYAASISGKFKDAKLVEDCFLKLPQLSLVEWELERLYSHLAKWLQTPLSLLEETPLEYIADLTASTDYQFFEMKFGITGNNIVPRGQTECTISYKASGISGEISYIVDQSCIRIFAEGLEKLLSNQRQA
ncbi:MAG TPA: hypothetical protein VF556_16410 [Pyrinomonadaceae bacterium]|jgi:hypothetical protein